jgi:hypothetical protein
MSRNGYLYKYFKHTFCICSDGFHVYQKLFTLLFNYNLLFASLKLITNFENAY